MWLFAIALVAYFCAVGALAFHRPDRVLLRSAMAVGGAIAFPYLVAFVAGPFLGEGAGMGVAFILYACAAAVLLTAVAASLGAGARHAWSALRP